MTEPDLHALRLAARHLQAVLDVCKRILPEHPAIVEAREQLHELLELSGPVRDAQLRTLAIGRAVSDTALRRILLRRCSLELGRKEKHAVSRLDRFSAVGLLQLAAQSWPATTSREARAALLQAISHRRRKLLDRIAALDPDDPNGLHRSRIALKRYRYLIAAFEPYAGARIRARSGPIERLQHRLGKWHDARVLAEWLQGRSTMNALGPGRSAMKLVEQKMAWCDHEQRLLVIYLKRVPW